MKYVFLLLALAIIMSSCSQNIGGEASKNHVTKTKVMQEVVESGKAIKCPQSATQANDRVSCDDKTYSCENGAFKQGNKEATIWLC